MLRHRHERNALGIKDLDDLGKVGERAGQPVNFVDHDDLDLAVADLGEQMLQCRPFQIPAGAPAIIVGLRQTGPALMALAPDKRFAGLALGMQRVELLLQPLFGGFAGVDRTAQARASAQRQLIHSLIRLFRPS